MVHLDIRPLLGGDVAKELSWEEAIQRVLREAGTTLRAPEISERILSQRLREKVGATPASTVAAIISISLREENSPFLRVGRGQFALKNTVGTSVEPNSSPVASEQEENETGALQAFGMFWQREAVSWAGKPKILGRQGPGASEVNFSEQIGVYLLHDRERVIYVGRATDNLPQFDPHKLRIALASQALCWREQLERQRVRQNFYIQLSHKCPPR